MVVKFGWVVWLFCWKGWDLVSVLCVLFCFVLIKKVGWMFFVLGDVVFIVLVIKVCV